MLIRLRKSLLASAAARNLALNLVKAHGACALQAVDEALLFAAADDERMLIEARRHVLDLVAMLPAHPHQPADGDNAPASNSSKRSR